MRKLITAILCLSLVLLAGCTAPAQTNEPAAVDKAQEKVTQTQPEVQTETAPKATQAVEAQDVSELDTQVGDLDNLDADLDTSDLDALDSELAELDALEFE